MTSASFSPLGEGFKRRWPVIDVARGIAIIAMILFHFTWDLGFFGIIDYDISFTPEGRLLAHCIAGSFLFIVGISLALAARNGLPIKPYLRRLRYVAGAAIIVSVGTFFTMPDDWIFFGVLHCIALSSLLALPFLRAPILLVAALAIFSIAAPFMVYHPLFDRPWLFWLGLNHVLPRTNDYVPFFPWFGVVLAGSVAARFVDRSPHLSAWFQRARVDALSRSLARLGRFSLPVYLLHQPILMGLLWALLSITGPLHLFAPVDGGFAKACTASCVAAGNKSDKCVLSCSCVGNEIATKSPPVTTLPEDELNRRIDDAILICRGKGAL
ncbi:MAG: DUF1624 domain-containing protein [Alphaproteobacteria bacterium]|nr:heparan-alpha-glucosaminide N-acetyltransferase [Beijerinckiaceae bacterium]NBQ38371.1 DUF1624 domain-containing protein [Alphaproteobacteria bacterium]